ncbi:MAG: alpha/beta fold hydrolase [Pseudomonadota bacterium]
MTRALAAFAALLFAVAACVQIPIGERVIFQPPKRSVNEQTVPRAFPQEALLKARAYGVSGANPDIQHQYVETAGGEIAVTLARAAGHDVLFVHCGGNGADRLGAGQWYTDQVLRHGNVLLFDYPGYGDTPGPLSAARLQASLPELVSFAKDQSGGAPIVYWGLSLGGQVCARMAELDPDAAAVIVEASGPSIDVMIDDVRPDWLGPFLRTRATQSIAWLNAEEALSGRDIPILIIDAGADRLLPGRLGADLADSLREAGNDTVTYRVMPERDHNASRLDPAFHPTVREFLSEALFTER